MSVLSPNRVELKTLAGRLGNSSIKDQIAIVQERFKTTHMLIKMGSDGVIYVDSKGSLYEMKPPVVLKSFVSATGAGDW